MLKERRENMLHLEDYRRIAKETDEWIDKYNKGLITKEEFEEVLSHRYDSEKDLEETTR